MRARLAACLDPPTHRRQDDPASGEARAIKSPASCYDTPDSSRALTDERELLAEVVALVDRAVRLLQRADHTLIVADPDRFSAEQHKQVAAEISAALTWADLIYYGSLEPHAVVAERRTEFGPLYRPVIEQVAMTRWVETGRSDGAP